MSQPSKVSFLEFVSLMALLTAMTALSTDAVLPALGEIGHDLHITGSNNNQLIISLLFAGMALGQIIYGPLSDTIGRKRSIYIGITIFILGCILSIFSSDLTTMLIGRFLQGLGAASTRIVTMALIRDRYEGREMARVMSFIMTVFIFVPAVAPAFGEGVLLVWEWKAIFVSFLLIATLTFIWFALRQEETLPPSARVPFSLHHIYKGIKETCLNRTAFSYTIIAGIIFGAFLGYLSSAQQIFQDAYKTGEAFVLYFGLLSIGIGFASLLNARLVMRHGMRKISGYALTAITLVSTLFFLFAWIHDGLPPFYSFMLYGFTTFFCMGLLFGNLNAMAMEPLGHIAGIGAAVVGSLSTFISIPLGILIGRFYEGTILPLVAGFTLLGFFALLLFRYASLSEMRSVHLEESS
ncbi:multidrug effflux MFS transporter [Sulfurovum mangrovi]|uniref:multidrug effflux MFS transporter n=1 Tax=Sulfurovum mangrovi TaxID=2893889 RepID=UPI001E3A46A4|nr:multidrug effflux MFS transporter [Sulfurovum mangrovi]UFH60377.1 multidrug effflux MFS transporter [Sulfurovum mangrovi]